MSWDIADQLLRDGEDSGGWGGWGGYWKEGKKSLKNTKLSILTETRGGYFRGLSLAMFEITFDNKIVFAHIKSPLVWD